MKLKWNGDKIETERKIFSLFGEKGKNIKSQMMWKIWDYEIKLLRDIFDVCLQRFKS